MIAEDFADQVMCRLSTALSGDFTLAPRRTSLGQGLSRKAKHDTLIQPS